MSRLTSSQIIIFVTTALTLSLIVNIFSIIELNTTQSSLDEQQQILADREQEWSNKQQTYESQLAQFNQLNGQQSELSDIVRQLSAELGTLKKEQQQTVDTANLTKSQLDNAQRRIRQLDAELKTKARELEELTKTNQNLRRAFLQARASDNTSLSDEQLASFVGQLTQVDSNLSIAQLADGSIAINVPLETIFLNTNLDFTEQAEPLLIEIAKIINDLSAAEAIVIGHADVRPITSDLSLRYPSNWELSTARASKVVNVFIREGVDASVLTAAGKASLQPVRDGTNAEDLALNRRLEIQLRF